MAKFISVDCGKYDTKITAYHMESDEYSIQKFRTRMEPGTMDDDMLEKNTFLAEVEGKVYKLGFGAKYEAAMETSKKSEIHKVCTLAAIARCISKDKPEDVTVVIGIPYQLCIIPQERLAYKDYIIPAGKHTVRLKMSNDTPAYSVTFTIVDRYVFPESLGVIYMYPQKAGELVGISDIGNLNKNNTYCNKFVPIQESSFTDKSGGEFLITGLAEQLSSELGMHIDRNVASNVLLLPKDKRFLMPNNGDKKVADKSREVIDKYLLDYVVAARRLLDTKQWSLDFMQMFFIGGTTRLIRNEIKEIFGDNIIIPERPEFVNAEGFLKRICAIHDIDISKAGTPDKAK